VQGSSQGGRAHAHQCVRPQPARRPQIENPRSDVPSVATVGAIAQMLEKPRASASSLPLEAYGEPRPRGRQRFRAGSFQIQVEIGCECGPPTLGDSRPDPSRVLIGRGGLWLGAAHDGCLHESLDVTRKSDVELIKISRIHQRLRLLGTRPRSGGLRGRPDDGSLLEHRICGAPDTGVRRRARARPGGGASAGEIYGDSAISRDRASKPRNAARWLICPDHTGPLELCRANATAGAPLVMPEQLALASWRPGRRGRAGLSCLRLLGPRPCVGRASGRARSVPRYGTLR
jgi:hypothetical protein